jgi:hypothetical protein
MKPKLLFLFIAVSIIACTSTQTPKSIPEGTWNYDLIVNKVKAGKVIFSNSVSDNNYVIKTEMFLTIGPIENKSVYITTETKDFKPVKLEEYNTITDRSNGSIQEINKVATFEGVYVTLQAGDKKSKFKIDENFVLDGNYFMSKLIENQFKQGVIVKAHIYEPSVEIDAPILAVAEVIGYSSVNVGNESMKLLHLKLKIENFKSIDLYLNEQGVTEKMVLVMLNNEFVMERIK